MKLSVEAMNLIINAIFPSFQGIFENLSPPSCYGILNRIEYFTVFSTETALKESGSTSNGAGQKQKTQATNQMLFSAFYDWKHSSRSKMISLTIFIVCAHILGKKK